MPSRKPKHPANPHLLEKHEIVPAKIWELLRRNSRFLKTYERMRELDSRHRSQSSEDDDPTVARRLLRNVAARHAFAGTALEWLVPEPLFRIYKRALPTHPHPKPEKAIPLETIEIGEGTTPNPSNRRSWRWFKSTKGLSAESRLNMAGPLLRRGPALSRTESATKEIENSLNPLKEWEDYQEAHGPFTTDDAWREAPVGFRREFVELWRQQEAQAVQTGWGAPHEVSHLCDIDLETVISDPCKQVAFAVHSGELRKRYRLFAIPTNIRTRTQATRMGNWLAQVLAQSTPRKAFEILGTVQQWEILLKVEDLMEQGASLDCALMESFEVIALGPRRLNQQKRKWGQRGIEWQEEYRTMNAPLGCSGHIQRIYPRPPAEIFSG